MNVPDILFLIICAAFVLDGYRVGFVKTFFSVLKMIIGVVLAAVVCLSVTGVIPHGLRYVVPVVFVSVYGIAMGILGAVERLLNIVDIIPVAKQLNRLCGIVCGLLKSIIVVWLIYCVAGYFIDTVWGAYIYNMFEGGRILASINEYNPLIRVVEYWWNTFSDDAIYVTVIRAL